jgi:hypothetical protein
VANGSLLPGSPGLGPYILMLGFCHCYMLFLLITFSGSDINTFMTLRFCSVYLCIFVFVSLSLSLCLSPSLTHTHTSILCSVLPEWVKIYTMHTHMCHLLVIHPRTHIKYRCSVGVLHIDDVSVHQCTSLLGSGTQKGPQNDPQRIWLNKQCCLGEKLVNFLGFKARALESN